MIVVEVGGFENVPFLERDTRNHVDKVRQLRLEEGHHVVIQKYFKKMETENDGLFFKLDLNEEGQFKNVFWANLRSITAYKNSGNDMLLTPFVRVNHHGHSILLECGLILHENTKTFTWLFDIWLSCMSNSSSPKIITDQDKVMKNAIEIVFINTRHWWCLLHILKKVPKKLGRYSEYHDIRVSLHCVAYDSQTYYWIWGSLAGHVKEIWSW